MNNLEGKTFRTEGGGMARLCLREKFCPLTTLKQGGKQLC